MTLDVRRMMLLAEVATHGSITAAAQALNYTPSAVSQQLGKLEAEAGQPLFERHPRGIALTIGGRALVEHATKVQRTLAAARSDLDDIAHVRTGELRIGTFPTAGASLLPLAVTAMRVKHPELALRVRSARFAQLIAMLESREITVSLLWDYDWNPADDPALRLVPLFDDPSAVIVSRGHRLAGKRRVAVADLAHEDWITRAEDHPVAEALDRSCRAAGFSPRIVYEAHDYQEAQAMAAVGLGIALAPRLALTQLRDDVHVVALDETAPTRRILLASVADRQLTPAEIAMTAILRDTGRKLATSFRSAPRARR